MPRYTNPRAADRVAALEARQPHTSGETIGDHPHAALLLRYLAIMTAQPGTDAAFRAAEKAGAVFLGVKPGLLEWIAASEDRDEDPEFWGWADDLPDEAPAIGRPRVTDRVTNRVTDCAPSDATGRHGRATDAPLTSAGDR